MKISKLFHWLYALLMLLPAFFVGGRMAYTIFNKNAKDSYSGNFNNIETREYVEELHTNNYYTFYHVQNSDLTNFTQQVSCTILEYSSSRQDIQNFLNEKSTIIKKFTIQNNSYIYFYNEQNTLIDYWGLANATLIFNFQSLTNVQVPNNIIYQTNLLNNENLYLDNAFDYSMSQLNELPLFSWAKDSFIVEPFTYITGLFGMPSDSPVLTLLSYWCSISLIWLTFDLLMYVPLLVHRWLDKGVLE